MKETLMALCALTSIFISCSDGEVKNNDKSVPTETTEDLGDDKVNPEVSVVEAPEGATLKVYKAPASAEFADAALSLEEQDNHTDGKMHFRFKVDNYELGAQTSDAGERNCANSGKGQHIHYIMNNEPYKAHYTADVEEVVPNGTNTLLAFLSRSYHESIKESKAAVVANVIVGEAGDGPQVDIEKDEILFYSRPKGTYKSSDGSRILLDFYLKNCVLGDGHAVRATINKEAFILKEWAAYFIEGLGVGTHTVRLELIDANGKLVPGAFNDSGDREFSITAD